MKHITAKNHWGPTFGHGKYAGELITTDSNVMPRPRIHRNDVGATPDPYAKVQAAPNVSLSVNRNMLPQPAVLAIGILAGIALLLLAYKYKPEWFRYFKPKTT